MPTEITIDQVDIDELKFYTEMALETCYERPGVYVFPHGEKAEKEFLLFQGALEKLRPGPLPEESLGHWVWKIGLAACDLYMNGVPTEGDGTGLYREMRRGAIAVGQKLRQIIAAKPGD